MRSSSAECLLDVFKSVRRVNCILKQKIKEGMAQMNGDRRSQECRRVSL